MVYGPLSINRYVRNLKELQVIMVALDHERHGSLCQASNLAQLRSLTLTHSGIDFSGARLFAKRSYGLAEIPRLIFQPDWR